MNDTLILHKKEDLLGLESKIDQYNKIKINIPDLRIKEIVNIVLNCNGRREIWVKTNTLTSALNNKWLIFKKGEIKEYRLKRVLDLIISGVLFILSLPIFFISSIAIKLTSPGSVFFQQPRVNHKLRLFNIYKFRTMNNSLHFEKKHEIYMRNNIRNPNPNQKIHKIVDDPRITEIGKWIRKLSIDELPQLINILKGEMSLVGPRPPIPYEVKEYDKWHFARFKAKPGLTGLWQALGRSLISFEEMVLLDLYYAYNQSLYFDIKILLHTIPKVLSLKGAF
jgi:lipopolysaccharide/colanic/teichoic acid biosynthesis glycosyltransferase